MQKVVGPLAVTVAEGGPEIVNWKVAVQFPTLGVKTADAEPVDAPFPLSVYELPPLLVMVAPAGLTAPKLPAVLVVKLRVAPEQMGGDEGLKVAAELIVAVKILVQPPVVLKVAEAVPVLFPALKL